MRAYSSFSLDDIMTPDRDPDSATKAHSSFAPEDGPDRYADGSAALSQVPAGPVDFDPSQLQVPGDNALLGAPRLRALVDNFETPDTAGQPTNMPGATLFFGGAEDQSGPFASHIVQNYATGVSEGHPTANVQYYGQQNADIGSAVKYVQDNVPPGQPITLVGHSLGGNTAAQVAIALNRPNDVNLITIDPVSGGHLDNIIGPSRDETFNQAHNATAYWANVSATRPTPWHIPNLIADIGGPWNDGPNGYADDQLTADVDHEQFGRMLHPFSQ
jgi:hypothetical protein